MSQENVELSYRTQDAFNRRDLDALLALMDDDVEIFSRLAPMEGRYHGHEGVLRWQQNLYHDSEAEALEAVGNRA